MIFIPEQEKLKFKEDTHQYFLDDVELHSVSRVIETYKHEFDPNGEILARKAAENGLTIEEQRTEWKKINKDSIIRGVSFHDDLETYIKTKRIPETPNKHIIKQFAKIKFGGMLYSEVRLHNKKFKIAGTSDILEVFPDHSISILDLKSNKKLSTYSWGRRMLYPLNSYWDANLYHYAIQLETYKFMLEEAGWWVKDLTLLYINPKTEILEQYPIQVERDDIIRMLEHYRENYNK